MRRQVFTMVGVMLALGFAGAHAAPPAEPLDENIEDGIQYRAQISNSFRNEEAIRACAAGTSCEEPTSRALNITQEAFDARYEVISRNTSDCPWKGSNISCLCGYFRGSVRYKSPSPGIETQRTWVLTPYQIDLKGVNWDWLLAEFDRFNGRPRGALAMNVEFFDSQYDREATGVTRPYEISYSLGQTEDTHWESLSGASESSPVEFYIENFLWRNSSNGTKSLLDETDQPSRSSPCKVRKDTRTCAVGWSRQATLVYGETLDFSHDMLEKDNFRPAQWESFKDDLGTFMDTMLDISSVYIDESQALAIKGITYGFLDVVTGNGEDDRMHDVNTKFTHGALKRFYEYQQSSGRTSFDIYRLASRTDSEDVVVGTTTIDLVCGGIKDSWSMNVPRELFSYFTFFKVNFRVVQK